MKPYKGHGTAAPGPINRQIYATIIERGQVTLDDLHRIIGGKRRAITKTGSNMVAEGRIKRTPVPGGLHIWHLPETVVDVDETEAVSKRVPKAAPMVCRGVRSVFELGAAS